MRISALPAALVLTAATIAGAAAPAAAETPANVVTLDAGLNLHHNTATVTYERVDGAVNSVKIISVDLASGEPDCAWVQWNDPKNTGDGWTNLDSEPSCHGIGLIETLNVVIKAPAGHPLKVRLASYHADGNSVAHKDVAKL
ncbi:MULTISPECIES: hypothetical protein [unclassified Streptomyces]|uniref:hypothetical protein n=1 Tax=unclassified Streptomyces TaxID=2593676 RepID=UPI00332D2B65